MRHGTDLDRRLKQSLHALIGDVYRNRILRTIVFLRDDDGFAVFTEIGRRNGAIEFLGENGWSSRTVRGNDGEMAHAIGVPLFFVAHKEGDRFAVWTPRQAAA